MVSVKKGNMYFFCILLLLLIGGNITGALISDPGYATLVSEAVFLLIPALVIGLYRGNIKNRFMINKIDLADLILVILVGLLSMRAVMSINVISMEFFHNFLDDAVGTMGQRSLLNWLLILAVTPAVCEEFVFRGAILSEYGHVSIRKAALMNGLMFGIFHLNANQFLYAFFLGVVMVYVVSLTKSMVSSIIMHFMLNGSSAVALWYLGNHPEFAEEQAKAALAVSKGSMLMIQAIIGIISIALIVGIIKWWSKRKKINFSMPVNRDLSRSGEYQDGDMTLSPAKIKTVDGWFIGGVVIFIVYSIIFYMSLGYI